MHEKASIQCLNKQNAPCAVLCHDDDDSNPSLGLETLRFSHQDTHMCVYVCVCEHAFFRRVLKETTRPLQWSASKDAPLQHT